MINEFGTKDIYFTAALMAKGFEISDIDKSDVKHQRFIFGGYGNELYELEKDYINKKFSVDLASFKESYIRLKSLIHVF